MFFIFHLNIYLEISFPYVSAWYSKARTGLWRFRWHHRFLKISSIILPSLFFHSVQPLMLPPKTNIPTELGELKEADTFNLYFQFVKAIFPLPRATCLCFSIASELHLRLISIFEPSRDVYKRQERGCLYHHGHFGLSKA